MKSKNLSELSVEELIKQQIIIKTVTSLLAGMLLVLFLLGIWLVFQKPSFLVFIVIPLTLMPLLIFNLTTLKKVKAELSLRENKN
nr:redox-active disulfide protein 2 [uncultured Flavobacterium sp.]